MTCLNSFPTFLLSAFWIPSLCLSPGQSLLTSSCSTPLW
uniref:Uncharacterized protein n=1 Tax=Anguilla anguilla TaxID=7936 RepID=A0A0E9UYT5_ANGAN